MKTKAILASVVLAASTVASTAVVAEDKHSLSANVGLASNYIWRGQTQTSDQAAIQGGVDYSFGGFYAGTWLSNVNWGGDGYEQDWYLGYGFDTGPVGWDVGYILYTYPVYDESDFGEIYANLAWTWLNGGLAYTLNSDSPAGFDETGNMYYYIGGSWDVKGMTLAATFGIYDFNSDSALQNGVANPDYSYIELSVEKDGFKFALDKNDAKDNSSWGQSASDYRFWLSYSKDFDLM